MSCQWPLTYTWNLSASYFTCSAYLGDKVCWTIMWLGILTFPLSLKISVPDIKHISFYFSGVHLPKSGYDLKLDPAMSRPWYSVFIMMWGCWPLSYCSAGIFVMSWHVKRSFFLVLVFWLSEWISSIIINIGYLKVCSSVGLPYSDWKNLRLMFIWTFKTVNTFLRQLKTISKILKFWKKFGKNKKIPF